MIVSASYRTDIPAFYSEWFLNRLRAGWCRTVNPYGGAPGRVDLTPGAVDGFVFWTRNLDPFRTALDAVAERRIPFIVHFTVTGYPRALERSVIEPARAVGQMRRICDRWGPRAVVWRYDPVAFTSLTPPEWHEATVAGLARSLQGLTDEVVVSFLHPYRKTGRNMEAAAHAEGFDWRDPAIAERQALADRLADIVAGHGMTLTLCTQPGLRGTPASCVDAGRLSDVAGRRVTARVKGNRPGCACVESRDIGAYDSCPHGCAYCYAVGHRDAALRNRRRHDPHGEFLLAPQP